MARNPLQLDSCRLLGGNFIDTASSHTNGSSGRLFGTQLPVRTW